MRARLGSQQSQVVDLKDGVPGADQGGHIIGARFYGPGEQINYYPQNAALNLGDWKLMENKWAEALAAGKDVKVEIKAIFNTGTGRPDAFDVDYWIDGEINSILFPN
jgi:filamentous hemagglutinin